MEVLTPAITEWLLKIGGPLGFIIILLIAAVGLLIRFLVRFIKQQGTDLKECQKRLEEVQELRLTEAKEYHDRIMAAIQLAERIAQAKGRGR